jgi:hypothetical protein
VCLCSFFFFIIIFFSDLVLSPSDCGKGSQTLKLSCDESGPTSRLFLFLLFLLFLLFFSLFSPVVFPHR